MPRWDLVKKIFSPASPHQPRTLAVLNAAYKHDAGVSLFFVDRQRQLENVICYIKAVKKNTILLKSRKHFLPDILNNEKCSIYFKLPYDIIVNNLKLPSNTARYGFLCKSRIISNTLNKETGACEILIETPGRYIQRELRRFERVYPSLQMVKGLGFWLPFARLPAYPQQAGPPDFVYTGELPPQLRLINISAGGARVQVDKVEFLEQFNSLDGKEVLLLISLYISSGRHISELTVCKCIESTYSIILRRLTLRLQFKKIWGNDPDQASQLWTPVGSAGVPAFLDWVNNDFSILMEKTGDQLV
ncbi:hypothetical protein [Desulfovibrio sp. ZJ200]|uniref:hypothetical protein n=1 Tax=Desulfovibrio sp. ZJ200 TaxID=2709792 RepID=UPI0013EA0AC3|nr:hypothetical protein [Desulfovibrio sp. ZJ200]